MAKPPKRELLTAWDLKKGNSAVIVGFSEKLAPQLVNRLRDIGFHPGESVHCVHVPVLGAPHLFRVSNTSYALEKELAQAVLLQTSPSLEPKQ